jgi:thiol:disulfide interchange protein DsbD
MRHIAALGAVFLFAWAVAASGAEPDFLKASLRFDRDALVRGEARRLAVVLDIEEGYHLNANPASAGLKPTVLEPESHPAITWGEVQYPPGQAYTPTWAAGENLSVYAGRAVLVVRGTVADDAPLGETTVRVKLSYQGCSESACFQPEMHTLEARVAILEAGAAPVPANADLFAGPPPAQAAGEEGRLSAALEKSFLLYLGVLLLLGLGLNLTPCVFPLIPVTMSIFAQQVNGSARKVLPLALAYVLGLAATFTVVGVAAALAGRSIGMVLQHPVGVVVLVGVLAILMASTFGAFEIRLPSGMMGKLGARRGYLGAIFMGIVMGAIAAPCVGPFLLALIALVAKTGSVPLGAVSFFATGIGLGLPYVFLGTFTGLVNRFPRSGGWLIWTKRLLGMSLAGLILWFANPYIDGAFFRPLALGVFLFAAVYLGILEGWSRRPFSKRFWAVRIAAAVLILAAGGAYGYVTADRPEVQWEPWTPDALEQAKAEGRPVLLYFGADWCFPCKVWHYGTFRNPEVIEASRDFKRIEADLTHLEEGPMKDFARRFNSVNPPGVFIIGRDGRTIASFRDPPSAEQFLGAVRNAATGGQEAGG